MKSCNLAPFIRELHGSGKPTLDEYVLYIVVRYLELRIIRRLELFWNNTSHPCKEQEAPQLTLATHYLLSNLAKESDWRCKSKLVG